VVGGTNGTVDLSSCDDPANVGPGNWRRLSRVQYENAVNDLLKFDADTSGFLQDSGTGPYKSKLIFADGLLLYGAQWYYPDDDNEHASGQSMIFTGAKKEGYASGPSIDQAVASHLYAQTKTKMKSLTLGVNSGSPSYYASCFFSAAQTPTTPYLNPGAVFDMLFKDFIPAMIDTTAADRLRRQKQSVLDLVKGDLDRICDAVGVEDKRKCESHLDGIRVLEERLKIDAGGGGGGANAACKPPTRLVGGELDQRVRGFMDLAVAALACDYTRSVAIQLGHCDGGLDPFSGLNQHSTTHDVGDKPGDQTTLTNHRRFDTWFAGHWAYLLGKLSELKDADGPSMIDNTLILFGSDTTSGQSLGLGAHCHWRFPLWMAGGSNFAFKTGRYLKLSHPAKPDSMATDKQWPATQRVLTSVGRAFGMDINKFGNMDPATGPLVGL